MTRAPLAAWQGLFAAGGAPAASHAALERVPVHARLLAPLAHASLVREGRFDTLVRPVQLGAVLGRRVASADTRSDAGEPATQTTDDAVEAVRRGSAPSAERRTSSRGGHTPADAALGLRARDEGARRHPRPPREPDASRRRAAAGDADPASHRGSSISRASVAPVRRGIAGMAAGGESPRPLSGASYLTTLTSDATRSAAITSIRVDAAPPSIRRLLDAAGTTTGVPSGANARVAASGANVGSTEPEAESAIERVLEKLATRKSSRATAAAGEHPFDSRRLVPTPGPGANGRAERAAERVAQSPQSNSTQQHTADATAAASATGGFRGLADRAMRQSEGAVPAVSVASPRLTHEVRGMSDLPIDALDASVADSVTRILQREARRHGIDLAGTGT